MPAITGDKASNNLRGTDTDSLWRKTTASSAPYKKGANHEHEHSGQFQIQHAEKPTATNPLDWSTEQQPDPAHIEKPDVGSVGLMMG
uniref:Uncharacterized protein n=1 Tax=Fagus sylvatica TaxID=28930 RepID=A0A2N9GC44_FAGSY